MKKYNQYSRMSRTYPGSKGTYPYLPKEINYNGKFRNIDIHLRSTAWINKATDYVDSWLFIAGIIAGGADEEI